MTGLNKIAHAGAALALCAGLAACPDPTPSADGGTARGFLQILNAGGQDVGLRPNKESSLRVRYTDRLGNPFARAAIQVAIYGDPKGSTLSLSTTVTDDNGEASVTVRAGASAATFSVRITASQDKVTFYIEVTTAELGALSIQSKYSGSLPLLSLVKVTYFLTHDATCATIDPLKPPPDARERETSLVGPLVPFKAVPLDKDHAVMARARDAKDVVRAVGCVDVPRSVLKPDRSVMVWLALWDQLPRAQGAYDLVTTITISKGSAAGSWPRPVADALAPWTDLSDCQHDPAQLLLDCIIDAVDSADPLDCKVPATGLSAKTAALMAERGALSAGCRGDTTARGSPSLDKTVTQIMAGNHKGTLTALAKVPGAALGALGQVQLESTLELGPLNASGVTAARHTLQIVTFRSAKAKTSHKVSQIGLPAVQALGVKATVSTNWHLSLARHQLSLRYGLMARQAMGELVLAKAGLPGSSAALAAKLAGLVDTTFGGKPFSGCPALEALACKAARLGPGCLKQACANGLTALATYLDAGFAAMDAHAGPDLSLEGSVDLLDSDGDLKVDNLGTVENPGAWTTSLGLGDHKVEPKEASFVGKRR